MDLIKDKGGSSYKCASCMKKTNKLTSYSGKYLCKDCLLRSKKMNYLFNKIKTIFENNNNMPLNQSDIYKLLDESVRYNSDLALGAFYHVGLLDRDNNYKSPRYYLKSINGDNKDKIIEDMVEYNRLREIEINRITNQHENEIKDLKYEINKITNQYEKKVIDLEYNISELKTKIKINKNSNNSSTKLKAHNKVERAQIVLNALKNRNKYKFSVKDFRIEQIQLFGHSDIRTVNSNLECLMLSGEIKELKDNDGTNREFNINEIKHYNDSNLLKMENIDDLNEFKGSEYLKRKIKLLKEENIKIKRNLMWKIRKLEKDKFLAENEKTKLNYKIRLLKEENENIINKFPISKEDEIKLTDIIKELSDEYNSRVPITIIMDKMLNRYNINEDTVEIIIKKLKSQGIIYEPKTDYFNIV